MDSEHLNWLPNPMLDESNEHFQSYESVHSDIFLFGLKYYY